MNLSTLISKPSFLILMVLLFGPSIFLYGQDDKTKTSRDTVYLYEEQIAYDTLYVSNTDSSSIEALSAIQYKKGQYYTFDENQTIHKLKLSDIKSTLSPWSFSKYKQARAYYYSSIPLLALGGGSLIVAGVGLVQYMSNFVVSFKNSDAMLNNDQFSQTVATSTLYGLIYFGAGMGATALFAGSGIALLVVGNHHLKSIAEDYNSAHHLSYLTAMKISFAPTPYGIGMTLHF